MEKNGKHALNEKRGKKSPANKMADDELSFIVDHIMSFPRVESHYCHSWTNKQYLSSDLNISEMHVLYQQKCLEKQVKSPSLERYRMEFKKLNLSFHKPKKDVCPRCFAYKLKGKHQLLTEDDKIKQEEHQKRKVEARTEKERDKERAIEDKDQTKTVVTFDLQNILDVPFLKAGPLYCSRKLASYNLTVFDLANKDYSCVTWSEVDGGRGCSEIFTALLKHLTSLPPKISQVVLFSDTCSGQNRNQFMTALLHNFLQSGTSILEITQKFLEPGHTHNGV